LGTFGHDAVALPLERVADPQSQYSTVTSLGRGGDRLTDSAAQNDITSVTLMLRCEICV